MVREEGREKLTFLIAGDGPDRERLENLTVELEIQDCTVFTGMISPEEVGRYYQLGDVFVCASNSETQGITYIEALASGVPALCRKDDCLNQVVTDGYNGFQYDSYAYFICWRRKAGECRWENVPERPPICILPGIFALWQNVFIKKYWYDRVWQSFPWLYRKKKDFPGNFWQSGTGKIC